MKGRNVASEPQRIVSITTVQERVNPEWLKWKRHRASVKQSELADQLGVSPQHISNIEQGLTVCSEWVRMAYEALGVRHDD